MTLAVFERKASCIDELEFNNRMDFLKRYGTKIKVEKVLYFLIKLLLSVEKESFLI